MKKTYLFWFAILAFLLVGCRNEDFSNSLKESKREEEFFRKALSKTARYKNGASIVNALKVQNERSHFVSKMKDQSGLPIWDKMITIRKPKVANKGESGESSDEYIIPLTENDKDLSSILFVSKSQENSFTFNNIDNERAKQIVYDSKIEQSLREQLLANFIFMDHLSFSSDATYWNVPDGLLTFIPESTIYPQRRFRISIQDDEGTGSGTETNNLFEYQTYIICAWTEVQCQHCSDGSHTTYETDCAVIGGGSGGGFPNGEGDTGGHGTPGDTGSGGGGGGGNQGGSGGDEGDDCGLNNKPFYKIMPCDDDGGSGEHGGPSACETIKTVGKNTKTKDLFGILKPKTNSTKEFGYVLSENGGTVSETPFEGVSGEASISFPVNGKIDGVIHSHYIGLLSVFSVSDMFALAQLYKNGNIKNTNTFVVGVVTASNTQYLMVIDDPTKFGNFANNLFTGNQIDVSALDAYEDIYQYLYKIAPSNTAAMNENAFVGYLQVANTGLKLLKGNSTFSNWSVLTKNDDGTIIPENCP